MLREQIDRFGTARGVQYVVTKSGADRDADVCSFYRLDDTTYDRSTKRSHGVTFDCASGRGQLASGMVFGAGANPAICCAIWSIHGLDLVCRFLYFAFPTLELIGN